MSNCGCGDATHGCNDNLQCTVRPWSDEQPLESRDINVIAAVTMMIIGMAMGAVLMQLVRTHGAPRQAQATMQINQTDCRFCHLPPPARTLKEYDKRIRKHRVPVKPVDLKELL